jgi:energy-coupling factor transporter ATP-binding protein EcfA2
MAAAGDTQDSSPRRLLVSWANEQDDWVRGIVAEIVSANRPLSSEQTDTIYDHFLAEKGLSNESASKVPLIELADAEVGAVEVVELRQLSQLKGVNALAADQTIEFDPCLTILFGRNGSGKTGYSRVLKRLAAVRTAETILPNAHTTDPSVTPSAKVSYLINGKLHTFDWENEAGVSPFTRMSVFDAPAVNLHVDDELNYVYTPGELALFGHVAAAIRQVQESLETEARSLKPSGNPFLVHFRRGTTVFPHVEALGPTTDLAELSKLADASEEGEVKVSTLTDEVAALKGGSVEARHAAVKLELERLERALRLTEVLARFKSASYESALGALRRLEAEQRRLRTELFTENELPGPPDDEWVSFITEADTYREHLDAHDYPAEGDACLYCRQALSAEAVGLLRRYRTFLDDAIAQQVAEAQTAFTAERLDLTGVSLDVEHEDLRHMAEAEPTPPYLAQLVAIVDDLEKVKAASDAGEKLPVADLHKKAATLGTQLEGVVGTVRATLEDLAKQREDRVAALEVREAELGELVAKRSLARHQAAMETFVSNAKRATRMETLGKAMSTGLLRSLTNLSKIASEDLVNKNFERLFDEECLALRAPSVALEFQGRKGRAERKKAVARYKPSEVLSEGEQKVLAISDFLAECRMSGVKAPIIFDDPVTSLDYERLGEVAQRISRLGETHQVIVFTHNIFFASTLLALRNSKKLKCRFYEVRDVDSEKGIVLPDVEPRQDNPADIAKRLNVVIEKIGSADPVIQDALIEGAYGTMRSWCEAFVEQEVLENVSQRFRVHIMMGGLEKIRLDRFEATTKALTPMFDRCSRFMPGHSQPAEQLNVKPTLAELEADWKKLQEIRKAHIA